MNTAKKNVVAEAMKKHRDAIRANTTATVEKAMNAPMPPPGGLRQMMLDEFNALADGLEKRLGR